MCEYMGKGESKRGKGKEGGGWSRSIDVIETNGISDRGRLIDRKW